MKLIDSASQIRVSSTLEKSTGKKNLIDGSPETCWTSAQGSPQHIQLSFDSSVIANSISLTFQGGFVGRHCAIFIRSCGEGESHTSEWALLHRIYPEDVNRKQIFPIPAPSAPYNQMKLVFEESSDFFGRIVVYDLLLEGE